MLRSYKNLNRSIINRSRKEDDAFDRTGKKEVKTLQLVMITTYGVRKNNYSNIVSGQVVLEDLFRPVFRY